MNANPLLDSSFIIHHSSFNVERDPAMKQESLTALNLKGHELEIVENGGAMFSAAELLTLIKTGQIPLIDPPRADERRWCSHAINGDTAGAATCACLVRERQSTWCSLNGREQKSPCVFDEAPSAEVWQEIREYVARWGR
jgi:hypothetical protein